jgi:hypothetical protein
MQFGLQLYAKHSHSRAPTSCGSLLLELVGFTAMQADESSHAVPNDACTGTNTSMLIERIHGTAGRAYSSPLIHVSCPDNQDGDIGEWT